MPDTEPNEILAAAHVAKQSREAAADTPEPHTDSWALAAKIGVGVGIGSAALAAALLFANRSKRK